MDKSMGKITFSGKDFTPGGQYQLLWSFISVAICYCKEHMEVTKRLYKQLLQTIHLLVPGWPVPTSVKPTLASSSILSSSSGPLTVGGAIPVEDNIGHILRDTSASCEWNLSRNP